MRTRWVGWTVLLLIVGLAAFVATLDFRADPVDRRAEDVPGSPSDEEDASDKRVRRRSATATSGGDRLVDGALERLSQGGLGVTVLHRDGENRWVPLEGAVLILTDRDGSEERARTSDSGEATIRTAPGHRRVKVQHEGYRPFETDGEVPRQGVQRLPVSLVPGNTVHVTVTDAVDGEPVQGAQVAAIVGRAPPSPWSLPGGLSIGRGATWDDGTWMTASVAIRPFAHVVVRARGYAPRVVEFDVRDVPSTEVTVALEREGAIEGTVVGLGELAPTTIDVRCVPVGAQESDEPTRAACDTRGAFRIAQLQPNAWYEVGASSATHGTPRVRVYVDAAGSTSKVELRFPEHRAVTFRVVGPDDQELDLEDGSEVTLVPRGATSDDVLPSSLEATAGNEVFVPDGLYDVDVQATEWLFPWRTAVEIGPSSSEVLLRAPQHHVLTGRVIDAEGRPVAAADIEILGPTEQDGGAETATDEEGRFRFAGVRAGTWRLQVRGDFESVEAGVLVPGPSAAIRIPEASRLLIQFREEDHGRPVAIRRLVAAPPSWHAPDGWRDHGSSGGSAENTEFEGVAPGRYRIQVDLAGYVPWQTDVEVPAGTRTTVDVGPLTPAVPVRGVVRGPDGRALARATVGVRPGGIARSTATGPDGTFAGLYVPPGPVDLWVSGGAFGLRRVHAVAKLPGLDLDVTLDEGAIVHVVAVDERGRRAAGVRVHVQDLDGNPQRVDLRTDHRGATAVGLPSGTWRIVAATGASQIVRVAAGESRDVTLRVE